MNASARASVGRAPVADGTGRWVGRPRSTARRSPEGSRLSQSATTPAIPEHVAATTSVPVRPSSSMSTRPAANVPMIAPTVFAA